MVACAALSSIQPPNHLAVPMTACAQTVEELKARLLSAAENDDEDQCNSILDQLRKEVTTRHILEITRVGFHVNNVRKGHLKKWPQLAKKCRDIIRQWQEFVSDDKSRSHSGASSRNTTPNLLSPGIANLARRGITPNTPIGRRVTSTGIQHGRLSATVSPANSSYAPRNQISPIGQSNTSNGIHKSLSVGTELSNHSTRPNTPKDNGKRKADEPVAPTTIKRTKTAAGSLVSPSTPQSVSAARKAVQSTSELVAELSQNLPEHMNIDSTIREHEEKVKRENKDEEIAVQLQSSSTTNGVERKKRKYERKMKTESISSTSALDSLGAQGEDRRGGLVIRIGKSGVSSGPSSSSLQTLTSKNSETQKFGYEKIRSIPKETTPPPALNEGTDEVDGGASYVEFKPKVSKNSSRKSWSSLIPSLEELKLRAEQDEIESTNLTNQTSSETLRNPTKVQKIRNYRRPILMLPYLDNPLGPDFLVHKYRNSAQYYSEDNFLYGGERPT